MWTARKRKGGVHDPKNTIVSPGVTALVKSRRACIQYVQETGWPAELAGGVNRLKTPATEVERRVSGIGGGLQGKSKLRITPGVDELLPRKIRFIRPDHFGQRPWSCRVFRRLSFPQHQQHESEKTLGGGEYRWMMGWWKYCLESLGPGERIKVCS